MRKGINILVSLVLVVTLWFPVTGTAFGAGDGNVEITDLRTEYTKNPLGIDVTKPRLSWKLKSGERGQYQTAYHIQVASSEEKLRDGEPDVWDTGKVESDQSVNVEYDGKGLESRKRYYWRVKVWDKHGHASEWSDTAWWEMGPLDASDWRAEWIGSSEQNSLTLEGLKWIWYPEGNPAQESPAEERYFRKTFHLPENREVVDGKFLLTADDGFVLYVNGEHIASSPRVTDSWKKALSVDVASALKPGTNVLAIQAINDGGPASMIGSLRVDFKEGEPLHVPLDRSWKTAKDEQEGWEQPDFDDGGWMSAREVATYGASPWGKNVTDPSTLASPYLRKDFSLEKQVERARLYSTALGLYEPYINGERVGQDVFTPGWTDYNTRIQYQTYDVTELLQSGENVIGAVLGDGWYAGHVGLVGRNVYGEKPHLLMQLEIDYTDGTSETIVTDRSWKWARGPIQSSDLLMGETYDARQELPGWNAPGYDASDWETVDILDNEEVSGKLVAQAGPTVQVTEEIQPVEITEPEPGVYIFDLGQNMVGSVRLKVKGEAGKTVTLRHGEVLNPDGTLYTANLRSAEATDRYILKGEGEEIYEPHFTFHGFRYVEVTGLPGEPTLETITGRVMHTAAPFSGKFETSNAMLNQLQSNITWGQRGNFLSIPTDTPARDERLGWTGDINVFVGAATFNMDVSRFLGSKWLQDLRDAQSANGAYPDVAPKVCCGEGNAGWGDAGVTVPYAIWQRYGDTRVIEENYEAMVKWIDYMERNSNGYIRPNPAYGDWLNVNDPTPGELISTAYFAHSTKLLADMARAIGKTDDAARFEQLFEKIKSAYNERFVSDDGQIAGNSQTAYVLSLYMDLLPEDKRQAAAGHLVEQIKERDWHLSTGFLGTWDLLPVLSETGHLDVAYRLLLNDTFPSWGYQIKNGATTMWERWDSIRPDGSFQDAGMNSFNHYAYGAVGDWMYRNIAGIQHDPENPGYKHTIIRPQPGGDLTYAKGEYESVYGTIVSDWKQQNGTFTLEVTVPVNTTATVHVPADSKWSVTEGGQLAHEVEGITFAGMEDGYAVFEIGAGKYQFVSDPLLGKLGYALDETGQLREQVDDFADKKELTPGQTQYLRSKSEELIDCITATISAYLEQDTDRTVKQLHQALSTANDIEQWLNGQEQIGQIASDTAKVLKERVYNVSNALSAVSAKLLGIQLN